MSLIIISAENNIGLNMTKAIVANMIAIADKFEDK